MTVHLYDMQAQTLKTIDMGDNSDCYIPRLYWLPNAKDLVILKMNRHQNEVVFHSYNTANGQMRKVYTDVNDRWLDITDEYYFLKDNKRMIVTSERNGFNHLYMVDMDKQGLSAITSGEWEVASVCAVDEKNQWIYYLSNESGTLNRDLYRINFNGKDNLVFPKHKRVQYKRSLLVWWAGHPASLRVQPSGCCSSPGAHLH